MHAVVVKVTVEDAEASIQELRDRVVPAISQAPGFVTGHWTRREDNGLSMTIWDSEEHARAASERIREVVPAGVTINDVELREVVASA